MADTIVKSFVIDTTESEQNLKELNTQINATSTAINQGAQSFDNVAVAQEEVVTSSKSLRAQLRDLQQQLAATEPDSAKYIELSQAAGELRDRIGDAAEAVGTQAGGAFERISGSLGLVTSRITNLDFEGAAEGAKLLATNITQVKTGDVVNGIKGIGSAFVSVGKALLTNPIFLIGAAIAAAVVYSEELLSLIDGVTDAELERLDAQKESAAQSKQQLDAIGQQENILRLAGKTEKEILQTKIAQAQQAILDQKAVIETLRVQRDAQVEAAERNRDILKGLLNFVSLPITALLAGVDILTEKLNGLGLITDETFAKFGNLRDKFTTSIAELVFDPAEVQKEGDDALAAAEKGLKDLENAQAGFQLSINQINQKGADERKTAREKEANDRIKAEQQTAEELEKIRQQELDNELKRIDELAAARKKANEDRIATEDSQFALRQELTLTAQQKEIQAAVKLAEDRLKVAGDDATLQKLVAEERDKSITEINAKYAQQQAATTQATSDAEAKSAEERIATEQQVQDAKIALSTQALSSVSQLIGAFAKQDEASQKRAFRAQKAISVAQATIDTYASANAAFLSTQKNPVSIAFPAAPYIAAGAAVAAGIANVATIAKQQFTGSTPAGGNNETPPTLTGGGGGGNESQPAQFNPLAAQFIQNQPEQITPRAFVLAGDVSSQQEVREKVQDLARLG